MSIYVDKLEVWGGNSAPRCFRHKPSCHMYADSLSELHAMALQIGLRREWFQDEVLQHYDLTAPKRALAIQYGAKEETWKHMLTYYRRKS